MKKILSIVLALCSAVLLQAAKVNKEVTIKVGNDTRKYWLYVPTNVKENCPFVLSLHGAGGHDTDKSPFRTDVADKLGCLGRGERRRNVPEGCHRGCGQELQDRP